MVYYAEILNRFDFAESDMEYVLSIKEKMEQVEQEFVDDVTKYLQKDKLFMSEYGNIIDTLNMEKLKLWYRAITSGKLTGYFSEFVSYFNLHQVPRGGFSGERISELFNFVRIWFQNKLIEIAECEWDYKGILQAYTKVINAAIYVTMNTYVPRDKSTSHTSKMKNKILQWAEKASLVTHSMLLIFLIIMTLAGVGFFIWSLWDLKDVEPGKLFVTALGSLLVLWVLIELINSEIQMLKGDKFKISIFVGVVLIAFIREVLIMTLKHDAGNMKTMILMLGGILVLGVTYWLLAKSEEKSNH